MEYPNYSAGLISQSFWFVEMKKVIKLIDDGKSDEEIKKMCIEENLFGAAKEYRAKRIYGYIWNRAKRLDKTLIDIFCTSDLATQKVINLIAILRSDRLFFEFMFEVYREKNILGIPIIEDADVNIFFKNKEIQSEDIADWTDGTKRRLRSIYFNYLKDANLLMVVDKKKTITPPILDIALERYHFIVTADHGFIYKRDKIQATDKIAGAASKSNSVGQRYSISSEEIKADGVCHTMVGKILGNDDERIVSFPLASDIFKVAGAGQNYVHGGCSPQEMIVPMIDVKVDKGKKETSLAEIALVSLTSKITNLITTLDFVQTEPVSDIVKETSYRVYFISDNNEKISNENIVIADKKDKDTTKRMFRLRFNFKNKKYDKSQKYYLVAYDDKNDIEVLRHEIIMDIAFADDFGF